MKKLLLADMKEEDIINVSKGSRYYAHPVRLAPCISAAELQVLPEVLRHFSSGGAIVLAFIGARL